MQIANKEVWGLLPRFWAYTKLLVNDVHALSPAPDVPGVFCLHGQPALRVELVGVIVAVDQRARFVNYLVDDGTGAVSCVQWLPLIEAEPDLFSLGDYVSVRGTPGQYRNERNVTIRSIVRERDANVGVLHWLSCVHLARTVYCRPIAVPPQVAAVVAAESSPIAQALLLAEGVLQQANQAEFSLPELEAAVAPRGAAVARSVLAAMEQDGLVRAGSAQRPFCYLLHPLIFGPTLLEMLRALVETHPHGVPWQALQREWGQRYSSHSRGLGASRLLQGLDSLVQRGDAYEGDHGHFLPG